MQAGISFATPWRASKTATIELLEESTSPRSEALPRIPWPLPIWEETLSSAEKSWKAPDPTNAIGTSAISQEIEGLLKWLIEKGLCVMEPNEIRQYLLNFPELIEVVPVAVRAAYKHLPKAQLILQVYRDPEIDDSYLTLEVRLKEYDESVMSRIDEAESEFIDLLVGKSGWLLLTTDFQEPEASHVL